MKPLEDILIVELSTMVTASLATMMMADQGARVIKVEPTEGGDLMRHLGTGKAGISALFANCNRGKASLAMNLKSPEGREILEKLVGTADVLIHNYRPGVMDQLGLGADYLTGLNPRLVYLAISGFGFSGPLADAPAYDPVVQAHSGFTALQGKDNPEFVRSLVCDKITAYTASQAVTAALYQREKTGAGQYMELSMLDASLFFLFPDGFMNNTLLDDDVNRVPPLADMYRMTRTRDGGITIAAASEDHMRGVMRAIDREDLLEDPRFGSMSSRMANADAFQAALDEGFAVMSSDEAVAKLRAADVPSAKSHDFEEVLAQAQIVSNGTLVEANHERLGRLRQIRSPTRFGGQSAEPSSPCPGHGEHSRELLVELGYATDDIERLVAGGIVTVS